MRRFHIHIEVNSYLTVADIWPDGNGTAQPTAADVIAEMRLQGCMRGADVVREWNLEDECLMTVDGVEVERG